MIISPLSSPKIIKILFILILTNILFLTGLNFNNYLILHSLSIIIILYVIQTSFQKSFVISFSLICLIFLPILIISIPELYLFEQESDNEWINSNFYGHSVQFLYFSSFLLIPTIIKNIDFKEEDLFFTISIVQVTYIIFNIYLIWELNNDRSILNLDILWPIILYDYIIIALSLLLFSYSVQKQGKIFQIISFLSIINIFLICLHGSKGAWIGIPICFLILIVLQKNCFRKVILYSTFLALLLISSIQLPNSQILKRIHYFKIQTQEVMNDNPNNSTGVRLTLWKHTLHNFYKNPIIGQGFHKTYQELCELQDKKILTTCQIHVHNVYLQFLYAYGILGFITSIFIFLIPIFFYYRHRYINPNLAYSGIVFCTYISICSLTDYSFFYLPLTAIYFLVNTILISFFLKNRSMKQT